VIENVVFDGPMSLPASIRDQLVAEIKQSEHSVGTEWLEELNEIAIRGAWQDQGFFNMRSTANAQIISGDAREQRVSVVVHVEEGIQYRLSEIRFRKAPDNWSVEADSSHTDTDEASNRGKPTLRKRDAEIDVEQAGTAQPTFPLKELRASIPLSDGELFRTDSIREGLDALKHLYSSHGYIEFVATPITEVDDDTRTILLIIELNEGKPFHVRSIGVQGLDQQTEAKLKWRIQAGDVFDNELFEDFFADNKDVLPAGASPKNAEMTKIGKYGTVDIRVVFRTCE
jgi:outer membrane protein assembly factor BamA